MVKCSRPSHPRELSEAVTLCFQYSRVSEPGPTITLHSSTKKSNISVEPRVQSKVDAAFVNMLDPLPEAQQQANP